MNKDLLLDVKNLRTHIFYDEGTVKAVDGVSFQVQKNKTVGIVGESGCGKSITALSILQVIPKAARIINGSINYYSNPDKYIDIVGLRRNGKRLKHIRGNEISLIFQEPMTAFSPVYTVGNQIMESILLHYDMPKHEARERSVDMLDKVGIPKPEANIDRYPFELSGGMRQRAMIAMALVCDPNVLIADEPTTAIDVTIQAQVLDLMKDLQKDRGMGTIMITHDLGVIAEMADDVVVMYLGKVVERGTLYDIFDYPSHPYTKALMKSIPTFGMKGKELAVIQGSVPGPYERPVGCEFAERCESAMDRCFKEKPKFVELDDDGHYSKCFLHTDEIEAREELGVELNV